MRNKAPQGVLALAASLMLLSGPAAAEFLDFTIEEGSVPGAVDNTIVADKLNGGYEEVLTINPDFTFDTQAFATFGQIFADEGTPPSEPSQLSCIAASCYNMYAVFSASGSFAGGTFTGVTGTFTLYIDPDQDTTATLSDGATAPVLSGTADDYAIAFAVNPVSMVGIVGNPGAFDFVWDDFTLTAAGMLYFVDPDPFHMRVVVDGDFDEFPVDPGDIFLTGDVSAVFEVPEPASIALFGVGLAALGFRLQRKR